MRIHLTFFRFDQSTEYFPVFELNVRKEYTTSYNNATIITATGRTLLPYAEIGNRNLCKPRYYEQEYIKSEKKYQCE